MKGDITISLPQEKLYTIEDYWNLPVTEQYVELLDGHIYYMAPPSRIHQKILGSIFSKISQYIENNNGDCEVYPAPFAVQLKEDENTIVEPDISVICDLNKLTDKGCTGAPDWIIEIVSPSNSSHDYVLKLNKYLAAGVREYWIVDPMKKRVFVYKFDGDSTELLSYTFHDIIKVGIYEDLSIDFSRFL